MKPQEITVGRTYARTFRNGAVGRRTVIGDVDSRNPRQKDDDLIQYRDAEGREFACTRRALAAWAQRVVEPDVSE